MTVTQEKTSFIYYHELILLTDVQLSVTFEVNILEV